MLNAISLWFWLAFSRTTDGERSLMYLLPFVRLYFQKRLFFIHFLKTGIFLFLCCKRSTNILATSPLSDLWFANISPIGEFTFHFLHVFWSIKAFNFDKVQRTYFCFYCLCFQCYTIKSTAKSRSWRFSSKVFIQF